MHSERTENQYGQPVITWTLPNGATIVATVTDRYDGRAHPSGGEVEVFNGTLRILRFDHTWAQGAAAEIAILVQNAYGMGQQDGLRATEETA